MSDPISTNQIIVAVSAMGLSEQAQFWMNWLVKAAAATVTLFAVIIALFKDSILAKWFPPKLRLELKSRTGERIPIGSAPMTREAEKAFVGLHAQPKPGLFYRLRVSNIRVWPVVTNVQVYLLSIEELNDGSLVESWSGEVPLRWQHQEIYPVARTIGTPINCDLCAAVNDGNFFLYPIVTPNNLRNQRMSPIHLVLSFQARSDQCLSPIIRIKIDWDGEWDAADAEMQKHFQIEDITAKATADV